ncbi:MAG TPA: hypothetical protein PK924_06935 [Bacilli bacterium]|nr:hypothetical protein [Bacilli bacterium]
MINAIKEAYKNYEAIQSLFDMAEPNQIDEIIYKLKAEELKISRLLKEIKIKEGGN